MPQDKRFRIEALDEIDGFLNRQSMISRKNLKRLAVLAASNDEEVSRLAKVVAAIGRVHPGRRRRYRRIKRQHPEIWQEMIAVGIVIDYGPYIAEEEAYFAELEAAYGNGAYLDDADPEDKPGRKVDQSGSGLEFNTDGIPF